MITEYGELLEVLIAVAEAKNFLEAARKLGISQAAVSLKIKALEVKSPAPLFRLQGKKKVLTKYGRALYETTKAEFELLKWNFNRFNQRYLSAENLTLKVGGRPELCEWLAPKLIYQGQIEFFPFSNHDAVLALQNHQIDLAISFEKPDSNEFIAKKILRSGAQMICDEKWLKGKPLSLERARSADFLIETPAILYQKDAHLLSQWLRPLGIAVNDLKPKCVSQDWRTILKLVEQGFGYAVVPDYLVPRTKSVRALALPETTVPHFTFHAIYPKDLKDIAAFAELLKGI